MRSMRKLAILLSSVLCALCLILGIAACGGNAAKEAIDMYLLPQNETAVNADFSLPKKIGDGIEVTWKSSNTDAIAIEDAGEEYTAKVTLQPEVTEVTLTISAEGASKDFHVRVEQLSVYTFMQNYTFKQKNTAVKEGFELDTVAKYKDLTATIAWEVKDAASKAYIEIDGNKVIVHPDDDLVNVEIVAKFTYNGQSVEATYPFSVSPILEHRQTVNRYYSVTDYPLELSGYIVHVVEASESYGNATFYMIDDDFCSGYYCYRVKIDTADVAKYVEGAHVTVSGDTTKNYNGLWENNSGGKAVIDDKAPINPREKEKVHALDTDLLADAPSMLWHESTFVSLTGWKVVDKAEKKPTAADSNLFAVENGGKKITVRVTKYAQRTEAELTALLDVYDSVKNGDIVNVVGILGNYNGFQIQPILASDITKTTATETTNYENGAKVKAAVDAVAAAVKKNFPGCIIEHKEITMPTTAENAEGVTISYRLAGGNKDNPIKNPTVVIDGGKFTIDPVADKMKNYDIEVTYTIGEGDNAYKAYSFFTLSNKQMTAEEVVEAVAKAVRNKKTVVIDDVTGAKTFYIDYTTVYGSEKVEWKVKGTAPEWLHVSGNKVTIDYLPMEETEVTLEATITFGDKSTTVDRKFTVAAMPRTMFQTLEEAKAGTYKFAMYNGNLSTTYYVTGTMDGAYLATTTEAAKGANFVITQIGTENKYTITINGKYLEFAPREDGKSGVDTKMNDKQTEGKYWQWVDAVKNFVFESLYNKDGNTESTETDLYYFGTYSNYTTVNGNYISRIADKGDDGTYTANGKEGDGQWVAHFGTVVDATDKAWADEVLASLSPKTTYTEAGTETLPTTGKYGATVTWTLKGTSTSFSVANNKLTVTLPASGEVTATLHVVVTVGKETAEKDVEITAKAAPALTLTGKGTEAEPYTVADALKLAGTLGEENNAYYLGEDGNPKKVYIEGYVVTPGGQNNYGVTNVIIADKDTTTPTIKLSSVNWNDVVPKQDTNPFKVGDHVVVYGYIEWFNGASVYGYNSDYPNFTTWDKVEGGSTGGGTQPSEPEVHDDVKYGSATAPLSVEKALALAAEECKELSSWTKQIVYMTGKISEIGDRKTGSNDSEYYQNVYLQDLTNSQKVILVFSLNLSTKETILGQNDTVVISGYITLFGYNAPGTIEFSGKDGLYPTELSCTRGESEISTEVTGATISGLPETNKAVNGTEISFTVQVDAGKKIVSVKVYDEVIEATEGTYKFTLNGNATIKVETIGENEKVAEEIASLGFADAEAKKGDTSVGDYASKWSATRGDYTWDIANFNNNSNKWNFIKTGHKTNLTTGTITTHAAIAAKISKVIVTIDSTSASDMNDYVTSFKLQIADTAEFTSPTEVTLDEIVKGENEFVITAPAANKFYRIVIDCKAKSNGFVVLSGVSLWGTTD